MKFLEDITCSCDTRQRLSRGPVHFKVSLPGESKFVSGDQFSIEILFLDCDAVLRIVDMATR